jgi:tetratricopeptide (TPR) repeat protein
MRVGALLVCVAALSLAAFAQQGGRTLPRLNSATPHEAGVAAYASGDYPSAIDRLKQALQADPQDKEATQLVGLSYYFTGHPKEAIPFLEKVQSWYSSANVDASYVLGLCYVQSLRYDDARHAFAKMYGVPPDSAPAHLFNARMLLRQGMDPIAENEAKAALKEDARLPLAHRLLGELYLYKSRIPEAISELEAELKINPAHAATYYTLADAYTRTMKFDEAERLLQRSIWLDDTASGPFILMGKVLVHKKEYALAERSLRHALGMDPNNYIAHHLLGQAYRAQGRNQEAERELSRAQELEAAQTHSKAEQQQ